MRKTLVGTILLGAVAATVAINGCSSAGTPAESNGSGTEPGNSETTGTAGIQLQVAPGITINTLNYTLTGPNGFSKTGSINVSNSTVAATIIGGLPSGSGYSISLSGE